MQLPITNFVTISVSEASPGLGEYNTSNLALFTDEAPNLGTFGNLGYARYLSPDQVATDFGSSSVTYQMALAVFSQQPNILTGGGELVVILITNAVNHVAFSAIPSSGTFEFSYDSNTTAAINFDDSASVIQGKMRAVAGLEKVIVSGSMATSLNIQMAGIYAPLALTSTANSLDNGGPVTITITTPTAAEDIAAAITRTKDLTQYFGVMANESADVIGQSDMLAAAAVIESLNKIAFWVGSDDADIAVDGLLDKLRAGSLHKNRGLFYSDDTNSANVLMMAAYAGRALSTNFNGSNTAQTMNLKSLATIQPDPGITQTLLDLANAAGADTYASYQGVPAVYSTGTNKFFDQVYNLEWIVGAFQVAGFNYLQQASAKIPQTESGMDGLKGAYRAVCEQAVSNAYLAPGVWNSPNIFGNPTLFMQNIAQRGYYIYSTPISQQSVASRDAREAPLIQIALKESGAIQSSTVIVTVNA